MTSKYFLVRQSIEKSIVGVTDGGAQTEIFREGFKNKAMYDRIIKYWGSYDSWMRKDDYHGADVQLQCVTPRKDALITSFLSYSPWLLNCPFLISSDVANLFKRFMFPDYYLYDASVFFSSRILNYYLFSCPDIGFSVVDFSRSIFFEGNFKLKRKYLNFSNFEEYKKYRDISTGFLNIEKIVTNNNFNEDLDFFIIGTGQIFISQRLMEAIQENSLSGLNFLPAYGEGRNWSIIE